MKKQSLSLLFSLIFFQVIFAQNEFGTIGSYWKYDYTSHDGNGTGWEMITVDRDTIIDSEIHKILKVTYYNQTSLPPLETNQGSYEVRIKFANDSVFSQGLAILDFDMLASEYLYINIPQRWETIELVVDSITTELIDGFSYKKWHGQKICHSDIGNPVAYEDFVILEQVGQITDYLFWNTDNCTIGGGFNIFDCYKNGDFTYPPNAPCEPMILSSTKEPSVEQNLVIYPNPTTSQLTIISSSTLLKTVTIYDLAGKVLLTRNVNSRQVSLEVSGLNNGFYFMKIESKDGVVVEKITRN